MKKHKLFNSDFSALCFYKDYIANVLDNQYQFFFMIDYYSKTSKHDKKFK